MRGAAMVRIPKPFAKSEAVPPRPFVYLRNRVRFAEPDECACVEWARDARGDGRDEVSCGSGVDGVVGLA